MENISNLYKQNFELRKENIKLKKENDDLKKEVKRVKVMLYNANQKIKTLEKNHEKYISEEQLRIERIVTKAVKEATSKVKKEYEEVIDNLKNKITKLEKRLNTDSTNSGIPTSKNRIGIKIPNTREKSDKPLGGQLGHKAHKLQYFKEEEITHIKEHTLEECPSCGGKLKEIEVVRSDIIDVTVTVTKTRNNIHNYKCEKCKKRITANKELPRGVSYGKEINTLALSLLNESNVALNKITKHIKGISNNEIEMSEGYLVKIQKKAANNLDEFVKELKEEIIKLKHVHWDDTVVNIQDTNEEKENKTKKGIIRFYGNDKYALLIGHKKKDKEGIEEDGILENLPSDCTCVHDHVLLNYNEEYEFKNAECNQHALRYLKGVKDNIKEHTWQDKMSDLLRRLNNERNELINKNILSFTQEQKTNAYKEYETIIKLGYEENKKTADYHYYKEDEEKLIKRLEKYKDNHLLFIEDFSVEFTNNEAERGLRQCKRKLATSFLFKNINTMKDYAKIISYLETCYRNGISRYEAMKRLVVGNPYTIKEIIDISNDKKEN